jgi:hypothetical protein
MSDEDRIKRKNLLLSYYWEENKAQNGDSSSSISSFAINSNENSSKDPYDINSSVFDSDSFLKKLIKVCLG